MTRRPDRAALPLALGIGVMLHACSTPTPRSDLSPIERRQDLDFVATEFAGRERSLTPHTRAVFEARLEEVRSQADFISHQELSAPFAERLPGLLADDGRLVLVLCRRA